MSSSYENVVGGKLKIKGKALDVKAAGVKKKKKNKKQQHNKTLEDHDSLLSQNNDLPLAGTGTLFFPFLSLFALFCSFFALVIDY